MKWSQTLWVTIKFQTIIKELFIRCIKLNISLAFITQSYFSVPNDVRLNSTHYLIMKINHKKELQNIAINHSADINYKNFMKIYRECTKEPYIFGNWYYVPSKHFLFSRRLQDILKRLQRNTFRLPRPLEDVLNKRYVFLKCLQDVFKTSS